jgi:hypothetical protein
MLTDMENKQCTKCGDIKPKTSKFFNKHSGSKDGLHSWCKICVCDGSKKWAQTDAGKATINKNSPIQYKKQKKEFFNKWGAGVYEITNLITAYNYIGESTQMYRRKQLHFSVHSPNVIHCSNINLQEDMRKYSPDAFSFTILEQLPADKKILLEREKYWINRLNPKYNIK